MSLLGRLALLFVIVPIVELVLLVQMGQWIGLWPTLLLVVATGVGGAALARLEGLRVFWAFQRELASGRIPAQSVMDGISVLIGGAFLLTPGVLTDLAGFSLLLPPTRRWIQRRVRRNLERRIRDGTIRVVTTRSAGGFGFGGFGGGFGRAGAPDQPESQEEAELRRPLDPSKGIEVDVDGSENGA